MIYPNRIQCLNASNSLWPREIITLQPKLSAIKAKFRSPSLTNFWKPSNRKFRMWTPPTRAPNNNLSSKWESSRITAFRWKSKTNKKLFLFKMLLGSRLTNLFQRPALHPKRKAKFWVPQRKQKILTNFLGMKFWQMENSSRLTTQTHSVCLICSHPIITSRPTLPSWLRFLSMAPSNPWICWCNNSRPL